MDALDLARVHPAETVIFPGIGFETTTPGIAATILAASRQKIANFAVFSTHKTMIPPLMALLDDKTLGLDGLLCPGHVSTIIGAAAYRPLAQQYHLSCVVSGFEPADILQALILMARQIGQGRAEVENGYTRAVTWDGNDRARAMVDAIFEPVDMEWRGLGMIAGSGLAIRRDTPTLTPRPVFRSPSPHPRSRRAACAARSSRARSRRRPVRSLAGAAPRQAPSAPAWSPAKEHAAPGLPTETQAPCTGPMQASTANEPEYDPKITPNHSS